MRVALVLPPHPAQQEALAKLWEQGKETGAETYELWLPGGPASIVLPKEIKTIFCAKAETATMLEWLQQMYEQTKPELLLFYGNIAGHELAVRLSARLGCPCLPEVQKLLRKETALFAQKKVCSSHLDWQVPVDQTSTIMTIPKGKAKEVFTPAENQPVPQEIALQNPTQEEYILSREQLETAKQNPLETAELLLIGGRGIGNKKACESLKTLAESLGGVAGLTRPAAMNGWGSLGEIVGQSGTRTAPDVCVTFGVSGAAAFMAGVENAKTLVAINTDPDAPIFKQADYGILVNAEEILQVLHQIERGE